MLIEKLVVVQLVEKKFAPLVEPKGSLVFRKVLYLVALGDYTKEVEMDMACSTHGKCEKYLHYFNQIT